MNIYLIETSLHFDYDCAEAFVVQACSTPSAIRMTLGSWGDHEDDPGLADSLTATKVGVVSVGLPPIEKVILRAFNAG